MTSSTRIAVLRISFDSLSDKYETEDAGDGWSTFEGADGARLEVCSRGGALLVRFRGEIGGLAASFGGLWSQHEESRGVAIHDEAPEGEDYEGLVEGASWERGGGGLFAQAASMLGKRSAADGEAAEAGERAGEASEEGDKSEDGEDEDAFDRVANKLISAVEKRSSRKVLATRLAAERGEKDLGDVLDAMESDEAEGDEALVDEAEGRFAFDAAHNEMAELLGRKLDSGEEAEAEDESDGDEAGEAEAKAKEAEQS